MKQVTSAPQAEAYGAWLEALKTRIRSTQARATLAVDNELVLLYWHLGRDILEHQEKLGWGAKVIDRLGRDLLSAFPAMTGLSSRNLKYMRAFAAAWPDPAFVQQAIAQLPWGHNVTLLEKLDTDAQRRWYAQAAIAQGWSRSVLAHQIDLKLIDRQGIAPTNFSATLPAERSELAQQLTKDPYIFETLGLGESFRERELEDALMSRMQYFIVSGLGSAPVASASNVRPSRAAAAAKRMRAKPAGPSVDTKGPR